MGWICAYWTDRHCTLLKKKRYTGVRVEGFLIYLSKPIGWQAMVQFTCNECAIAGWHTRTRRSQQQEAILLLSIHKYL